MNNKYIVSILLSLLIVGCSNTIPFKNYPDQSFVQYGEQPLTKNNAELAINRAAVSLGWKTKKIDHETIKATLDIRTHQLVLLITFDDKNYSIAYADSTNLKYNGKKIHRQYANWINNLINRINAENLNL